MKGDQIRTGPTHPSPRELPLSNQMRYKSPSNRCSPEYTTQLRLRKAVKPHQQVSIDSAPGAFLVSRRTLLVTPDPLAPPSATGLFHAGRASSPDYVICRSW